MFIKEMKGYNTPFEKKSCYIETNLNNRKWFIITLYQYTKLSIHFLEEIRNPWLIIVQNMTTL